MTAIYPDAIETALVVTSTTGVERDELLVPLGRLRDAGVHVDHAAPAGRDVSTMLHDGPWDVTVSPTLALEDAVARNYDVLLVPGGTINADTLRVNDHALALAGEFAATGKIIAAICHAPWLLVEADLLTGKTLTSYPSVCTDIANAGGEWVDEPVVSCTTAGWTLITSRRPDDLGEFVSAILSTPTTSAYAAH